MVILFYVIMIDIKRQDLILKPRLYLGTQLLVISALLHNDDIPKLNLGTRQLVHPQ